MKINIYKNTIDTEKLWEKVREFEFLTNQDAYLIMNENTRNSLMIGLNISKDETLKHSKIVAMFNSHKTLIDPELEDGEVNIR